MSRSLIRTPSRLHFGLLSRGPSAPRQFGGVGLMIDEPGIVLVGEPADSFRFEGPLADRVARTAQRVRAQLELIGAAVRPMALRVERTPPEHVGLGVGTQIGLAVAQMLAANAGLRALSPQQLAEWSGRGLRSGVGLHGFARGGLIVDGGRGPGGHVPPLLAHYDFPEEWPVLLVIPRRGPALHGDAEVRAFAALPPIPEPVTDRLSRIVLLGLLPAVLERDLPAFGANLSELQRLVGSSFAPAQGGTYADPELERLVNELGALGLQGAGQSSWGPTLYAFSAADEAERGRMTHELRRRFPLQDGEILWTRASRRGAVFEVRS